MLYVFWLYSTEPNLRPGHVGADTSARSSSASFVIFYLLGSAVLWLAHAPALMVAAMLGYFVVDADRRVHYALLENQHARARHHRAAGRSVVALRPAAAAVLRPDSHGLLGARLL